MEGRNVDGYGGGKPERYGIRKEQENYLFDRNRLGSTHEYDPIQRIKLTSFLCVLCCSSLASYFLDNTERHFYLFDTFEGLPEPSEKDDARAKAIWNQVHSGVNINKQKTPHRAEDGKVRFTLYCLLCFLSSLPSTSVLLLLLLLRREFNYLSTFGTIVSTIFFPFSFSSFSSVSSPSISLIGRKKVELRSKTNCHEQHVLYRVPSRQDTFHPGKS